MARIMPRARDGRRARAIGCTPESALARRRGPARGRRPRTGGRPGPPGIRAPRRPRAERPPPARPAGL